MNRSDAPSKKSVPFGINGPREAILDTTPAGNNQASYDSGFPPITMILKSAGGLPPKGEDFNQILYELALNARWNQAGAGYQFDSTFSTGISGYPIGAIVQNSTGDGTWINTTDGNTNNPEVATATPLTGWLPLDSNGFTTKSGLTNASVTLTTLEASRERIVLSGTLTANINLIVPAWRKKWTVVNNCSGSFSVTIKTTSGTGIAIPAGMTAYVLGDGTNVVQDTNILGISGRLLNVQTFTSSGTYTPTSGAKKIKVIAVGGGGAGGGTDATSASQIAVSWGGCAGAYGESNLIDSTSITTVAVTIGAAGNAISGANGGSGGTTSFGSYLSCPGGSGGPKGTANTYAPGTATSTSATGDCTGSSVMISVPGQGGGAPFAIGGVSAGYQTALMAGDGGSGVFGAGGRGGNGNVTTQPGTGHGAGGSGRAVGSGASSTQSGGAGTSGMVIVLEYA
ncbi:hypothetical protein H8V75_11605 [Enterobacter roggenkampii]|uniref:glycine-rich domain-containing protein n=1 Tax=Enterobacter roggenkampii TaxID=1812935 RepID=UPI001E5EFED0|nr:hypothetical protein [Enterobacter roggenkampii]MCC7579570.1 hypothetical protein [Enterobacter roggenkampii]MCC7588897.1 hypothetical protein [Enterobacter roggenkampii]MCC7593494.1 hypothetical protein [Enterobacter roggenkampii]MCC7603018.1 hypothetical protein [Enterobacter roggenkampii]MCC7608334.1 hypothetical protein [Enterobacter roggenkampii]